LNQELRRLGREADGSMTLYIGVESWPFPIPIVEKNRAWRFDPAPAISVCREFVEGSASESPTANAVAFHGYYFHVSPPRQTKATGGLALAAYPAEYRSSGVITFVVTQQGVERTYSN